MFTALFRGARRRAARQAHAATRRPFAPRLDILEDRSLPSTFTMTNLADSGAGSLQAAVAAANASPGPDAIQFAPGLSGTISLGSTLEITDGLTVQGPGPDTLTLYGNHAVRVIRVAAGVTAGISGLTVTGGWHTQGGGIRNDGSLTLDRVTVWNNEAGLNLLAGSGGGIYNAPGANLTITRSTISNNVAHTIGLDGGGGIYNGGALSVFATNFSGNEVRSPNIGNVRSGSAVYNAYPTGGITPTATIDSCTFTANGNNSISSLGNLTLRRSTVSGDQEVGVECSGTTTIDSCTVTGNGVAANVFGGGIEARGSLTLVNSTVAGNQGAGLTVRRGTSTSPTSIAIANCTIAGNTYDSPSAVSGAGIDVTGNGTSTLITLHNTILAGNVLVPSGGSPILKDLNTSTQTTVLVHPPRYESLGYNLIQAPGGATIEGTTTGNLFGIDPLLGPLADNGGPTFTRALLSGSPAINAGDNSGAPAFDQRGSGFSRIINGTIDIGAFEVQAPPAYRILDNGSPGFSVTPGWAYLDNAQFGSFQGVQGDVHYTAAGSGSEVATWTFTGLAAGPYQVSATWSEHANRATNAPFTVLNGTTPLATVQVNQELTPNDFTDAGVGWKILGTFTITGNTLVVRLTDLANEYVIADAVRIERVGFLGRTLDNGSPGFSVTPGWAYLDNAQFGSFQGVQGDVHYVEAGSGSEVATWTFAVTPGTYRVSVTWSEHANRATNAPYTVLNGTTPLQTVLVNQELAPGNFTDAGVGWRILGDFTITGTTLVVRLTNNANEYVIADAVRIERLA